MEEQQPLNKTFSQFCLWVLSVVSKTYLLIESKSFAAINEKKFEVKIWREGSLVTFLQIGESQTYFVRSRGWVTLFSARKILLHVATIKVDSSNC